jgi:hypothetical protein
MVTVSGPTPSGTGVIHAALFFTPSKSTSPTMRRSGRPTRLKLPRVNPETIFRVDSLN